MLNELRTVLLAVGILGAGQGAAESPPAMPEPPSFSALDADGDQMVTKDEFHEFLSNNRPERRAPRGDGRERPDPFDRADVDGDGVLSEQEYDDMMQNMRQMRPFQPPPDEPAPNE